MRKLRMFAALLMVSLSLAHAQTLTAQPQQAAPPPPAAGWGRVQALPAGTSILLKTTQRSLHCKVAGVTDESLSCTQGRAASATFARTDIVLVRVPHRGRSTLVGAGIGLAGGAIAGAATCKKGDIVGPGACAAILGIPLAVIGGGIGAGTDFTRSTVYKAH